MGTTTTYDVLLRYRLDNKATHDAQKLTHTLHEAGHASSELGHLLGHIGMIAGGVMSIHGAYEHLVMFNKEVENAKISLAAMVEGGFGGSFQYAKAQADALYNEFQKFSTQTPMTTQEMLEFSRGVAVSTQQAGGSIKDIVTITEQGAVAAKALGMESNYAARELSEMLSGNINNRMLFAKQLAGLGGKTTDEVRAMSGNERLQFLKATLTSPAMRDAVSAMSSSFSGVTSTLVDKIQILLGKVGLPLFKAITKEVSRWNEWIDKNQDAIDRFANRVATGLVDAFNVVKDVFSFIYDHADTFLTIGKVWAMIKIGNMAGGLLGMGGGGGGATAFLGSLGTPVSKLNSGTVLGAAMIVGTVSYELTKATGIGDRLADSLSQMHITSTALDRKFEDLEKASASLSQAMGEAAKHAAGTYTGASQGLLNERAAQLATLKMLAKARDYSVSVNPFTGALERAGINMQSKEVRDALTKVGLTPEEVAKAGGIEGMMSQIASQRNMQQGRSEFAGLAGFGFVKALERSSLTEYQRQTLNEQKAMDEVFGQINRRLAKHLSLFDPQFITEILKTLRDNTADPEGKHKAIAEKAKVNVTIHRIEVQSDDPDRFAFRFVQAFERHNKSPSQAADTLREG